MSFSALQTLNPSQLEAVQTTEGPVLVLAGAGSGKTRVITVRVAYLIKEKGVLPHNILAVTFTNKAAEEMRQRVKSLLDDYELSSLPLICTFHSLCVRILRRDIAKLDEGFTSDFTIYDSDDSLRVLRECIKELGFDHKEIPPKWARAVISSAKNRGEDTLAFTSSITATDSKKLAATKIFDNYQRRLKIANALDFDDLLLKTVQLLRTSSEVREKYNQRYKYILIDEYQDTNPLQLALIKYLTEIKQNICVVGDDAQSIYKFRQADIRNILEFEQHFPSAKVIKLEQNYRSTQNILDAAHSIIENNRFQKKKQLWTENPTGEKIFYYQARNAEEEAGFCVSEIERHLAADPASRIAVLYRTNAQSRLFEEYLRRARIEYNIVGGFSFYERQEIKDVISYLKLALNPRDNAAFERVYNTPPRGLGKTTLAKIADHSKASGSSLWESAKVLVTSDSLSIRSKNALLSFIQFIEKIKSKAESDGANQNFVSDLLVSAIEESGYAAMLRAENTEESLGRLENLEELVNAAAEYNANGLDGLREFIDHSALTSDADGIDERSRVTLMTIHAAKGLEFPIVFLVGLEDGIFPHSRSLDDQSELEEERRLAYVAITRAQKLLYLTHAMRRRFYGEDVPSEPSQFLDEIDRTVIEDISDGMSWLSLAAGSHKTSARRPTITNDSESSIKALEAKQPAPPKPIASPKTEWPGKTYNSVEAITEFFRSRAQKLDKKGFQASAPSAQSEPLGQSNDKSTDGYPQRAFLDETTAEKGRPGGSLQNEFAKEPQKPAEKSTPFERLKAFGENAAPSKAENRHQEAFTAGTQVRHEKYGRGLVLRREGSGDNVKLTISFPGYGLKKLIEKYANLQRV